MATWKTELKEHGKAGGIGAAMTVGLGLLLLLGNLRLGEKLIHLSYDMPFRQRHVQPPSELVLVYLDDDSYRELNQPYDRPWDRGLYGRLVERLTAENAKVVGFDIVFSDTNHTYLEGDLRFANAMKANGRVVIGADYLPAANGGMTYYTAIDPFFSAAAAWGMVQLQPDQDFVVRRPYYVPEDKFDDRYSSITWEVARLAGAKVTADPLERYRPRWINHYGPPFSLPNVSFHVALETNAICPAGFFSNKVVFVGANLKTLYSNQRKDELRTPYTRRGFCPAVDLQATQTLNLVRGDWLNRTPKPVELVLLTLAGLVFGYGLSRCRALAAVGLALGSALVVAVVAYGLFAMQRLWFPWMIIAAAQIPLAASWSVVFNSVQLYVQNRLYEQSLRMYLSPKLVKKFASDPDLLKPGARKQTVTALFTDIANFTSLSEGMDSDELARAMNKYFGTAVSQCIHYTDGTVVKYIGDAIFAFWNAPETQQDHAQRACEAALRFTELPPQIINGKTLVTRLGLHTGVANVGNFGSTTRVDYTAIGEAINLASRMEGLNKYLGTKVLITEDTRAALDGELGTRYLGKFRLKGFDKAVGVYELMGRSEAGSGAETPAGLLAAALERFQQHDLEGARTKFEQLLQRVPEDGPCRFYLHYLEELARQPSSGPWSGAVEVAEK